MDAINQLLAHAGMNTVAIGIMGWFIRRLVTDNDEKLKRALTRIDELSEALRKDDKDLAVSLSKIDGKLERAIASIEQIEGLKEKIWLLNSKVDAAFRIIDNKRPSDNQ